MSSEPRPRVAPGPKGLPLLGHAWRLRQDILGIFTEAGFAHDVARLKLGPLPLHLLSSPELAREVLQARAAAFDRRTRSVALLMDITGESLLTANGAAWARRRRLAGPAFHPDRLAGLVPCFASAAAALADGWAGSAKRAPLAVDAGAAMAGLAFRVAAEAFFSSDVHDGPTGLGPDGPWGSTRGDAERPSGAGGPSSLTSVDVDAMESAQADVLAHYWKRMSTLSDWPQRLPNPSRTRYRAGLARIRAVVDRILAARTEKLGMDLLDRLRAEGGRDGLAPDELRNEVLTLLMAGHETTAHAMAWALHHLARNPEAARAVRLEARAVLGGRPPRAEDLPRLVQARAAFQEALRLHPTIWVLERRAIQAESLGGYDIPEGGSVLVSPYVLHRHPAHWKDPGRFDPSRFLDGKEHPAYLPFGLGPHTCLGMGFAMAEGVTVLSVLLSRFHVTAPEAALPRPVAGLTLRVPGGALLAFEPLGDA